MGSSSLFHVAIDCVQTLQTATTGANCSGLRKSTVDIVLATGLFILTAHLSLDGTQ